MALMVVWYGGPLVTGMTRRAVRDSVRGDPGAFVDLSAGTPLPSSPGPCPLHHDMHAAKHRWGRSSRVVLRGGARSSTRTVAVVEGASAS